MMDEIRAAVVECSVLDGSTQKARQEENLRRRRLFKELDSYDMEQHNKHEGSKHIEVIQRELNALASTLVVKPVQPQNWPLFQAIDLLWRVPAVVLFLLFLAFVASIPLIVLTMAEQQLFLVLNRRRSPASAGSPVDVSAPAADCKAAGTAAGGGSTAAVAAAPASNGRAGGRVGGNSGGLSSMLIRLDCAWLLLLMGIQVKAEFMCEHALARPAMLLFTHVSTLDAVVILGTLPRALCAVVKEELLAVPVLGWIMASHGAIPINRKHRASAVQALAEAAERARELQMFVAMAPEGTRSKTGQLGTFKKGAFHMQEQLQWPVIPVTIHGAYELLPLKWNVNQCGKVVVQYHRPIEAAEIRSRDGLSRRLRQEILEALDKDVPEAGTPLDPSRRAAGLAATALTYWAAACAGKALMNFSRREGMAVWALVVGACVYIFLSTVFVFFVYARKCFSAPRRIGVHAGGAGMGGGAGALGGARDVGAAMNDGDKGGAGRGGTTGLSRRLGGGGGSSSREGE